MPMDRLTYVYMHTDIHTPNGQTKTSQVENSLINKDRCRRSC